MADEELQQIQAIVIMLVMERNRLATAHPAAKKNITTINKALKKELGNIETDIAEHIAKHHADLAALLNSVKGVYVSKRGWFGALFFRLIPFWL